MWNSGSKYRRIVALVKANCKWLKAALALEIKKLRLLFLALKLGEFIFFNNFFPDFCQFLGLRQFLAL